jgi:hypothetical protein
MHSNPCHLSEVRFGVLQGRRERERERGEVHCCSVVVTGKRDLCLVLNRELAHKVQTQEAVMRGICATSEGKPTSFKQRTSNVEMNVIHLPRAFLKFFYVVLRSITYRLRL